MTNVIEESDMTRHLASLLDKARIEAAAPPIGKLDIALARHANKRHRIAPLLHIFAKQGCFEVDSETTAYLQDGYRHAGLFIAQQQSVRQRLASIFAKSGIRYIELKGRGLAEQFYDDPAARFSKDIDILIDRNSRDGALKALNQEGFLRNPNGTKLNRKRATIDMWALKDTSLFDPKFGQQIELHQRLCLSEPSDLSSAFMLDTQTNITPKISNCFYILYLILHGANAHWSTLKWVMDISILLQKTPSENAAMVFDLAEHYHCTSAISASVDFAGEIFPGSIDDNWQRLAERYSSAKSKKLEASFHRMLFSPSGSVKRAGFPVSDWYIYDGGINYLKEAPRRLIRPFLKLF